MTHVAGNGTRPSVSRSRHEIRVKARYRLEAGHVSGTIVKVHTRSVEFKAYTHHASKDGPQYEIKSDKTDHIAMHKGSVLRRKKARGAA